MRSELIDERHLARRAIIYIRQSSPHQVLTNQESLRLQYDLRRRALDLGWREEDVEVIDTDLGLSGAAATHRKGFKDHPFQGLLAWARTRAVATCSRTIAAST
jgi:hypothetical protein